MKSLITIDFVIVGVYMVSMVAIGFLVSRRSKSDADYFKGGNKVPWLMACVSFFISMFSAFMFVAASGKAYDSGFACLLLFTASFYGYIICYFYFAAKWRRTRITSPIEYIQMRFGESTRLLFSILQIPAFILSVGSLIYILSIFISSSLGLTGEYHFLGLDFNGVQLCIVLTGLVIVAYTSTGGLWAVVVTDTVQFVIVMVVALTVLPLSVFALTKDVGLVAGFQNYFQNPPVADYFHLVKPSQTIFFTISWIFLCAFSAPGEFAFVQRSYCVPTEKDAKKVTLVGAILLFVAPILWLAPVFLMRGMLPDMEATWPTLKNPGEATYVTIAFMLLPNGMIGLTIAAIFAATMSSVSTLYNLLSVIFTRDIYKAYIVKDADPKNLLWTGRIATFAFGLASIIIGIILSKFADAFTTSFTIYSHITIAFAFPMAAGLLIKRVPWWTAMVAIISCFVTTLSIQYLSPKLYDWTGLGFLNYVSEHSFEFKVIGSIAINIIIFWVASLFYDENSPREQKPKELFKLLDKPVSEDENAALFIPDLKVYRIVGWVLLLFGASLIMVSIFGLADDSQNINLIVGLVFVILFALIQWFTSPEYSPSKVIREQYKKN